MAEDDLEFVPWYVDESDNPSCPSNWEEDFECDKTNCPFSHEEPKYQITAPITCSLAENPVKVYTDIKNYILTGPGKEPIQDLRVAHNPEDERDFERITQLMVEMYNFEKGPEVFDSHILCPFLNETGNCIIKEVCEFAHSVDDQKIKDYERVQEWYPSSMSCECCKGYVYGCEVEECKKLGKCRECVS